MKKLLIIFALLLLAVRVNAAITYSEAYQANDTKPMAVLIYADWADNYQAVLAQFRTMEAQMGNLYNFVEMDIASKDAKAYTEQNSILTKLPYIMLYRGKCKFARFIERSCASSADCTIPKMKTFIRQ